MRWVREVNGALSREISRRLCEFLTYSSNGELYRKDRYMGLTAGIFNDVYTVIVTGISTEAT